MELIVKNISKYYKGYKILDDISIRLNAGEIVSLLGTSGIGKTTLFNIVSGLEMPDSGEIILNKENITGKVGNVSYMQQKDLLLPHLTILENVSLPLIIKGGEKSDSKNLALSYFSQFGISGNENKYPCQLSGGMRQRAAFLRTYLFFKEPVLLDEPFSSLDTITKQGLYKWYLKISKEMSLSTIIITHDIDEAIVLSNRIYIMKGVPGKITDEILINKRDEKGINFLISDDFLIYKKKILDIISED